MVSNFLLGTLLISRAAHSNYSHMECWSSLVPPNINFIVMAPRVYLCPIVQELGFNPEKWLMPVLQNLYKCFFQWPPLAEKNRVIYKRLLVSFIDLILVKT